MDLEFEHLDMTFEEGHSLKPQDHIERSLKLLRDIERENQSLKNEICIIERDPYSYAKPLRDQLKGQIDQIHAQNQTLRKILEKNNVPAYSQMTKKEIVEDKNFRKSERPSITRSFRNSFNGRNNLEDMQNSYMDKNDGISTCYNPQEKTQEEQYTINQEQQQNQQRLTQQIRFLLKKSDIFQQQLNQINKEQNNLDKRGQKDDNQREKLKKVNTYKQKLVKLLGKLRNREKSAEQLIKLYQQMYEQTFEKLTTATQTLEEIRSAKISQNVEQKFAEVEQLEQKLMAINAQLDEMNEEKWLSQILKDLQNAVLRMGLQIPKVESKRQLIDELCDMLVQGYISSKRESSNKLSMLKNYHQQEKNSNNNYVMALKSKEQALGRQLIKLQMQK